MTHPNDTGKWTEKFEAFNHKTFLKWHLWKDHESQVKISLPHKLQERWMTLSCGCAKGTWKFMGVK